MERPLTLRLCHPRLPLPGMADPDLDVDVSHLGPRCQLSTSLLKPLSPPRSTEMGSIV